MSDQVQGVVVAHAGLAPAMVEAVERISGVDEGLVAISNDGLSPDELCARVQAAIGHGPAIIFADLASGSCALAGRRVAAEDARVAVVAGVSLPVLIDFVFHRDMEVSELAARLVERGRAELWAGLPQAPNLEPPPDPEA